MASLQLGDKQITLRTGDTTVGAGAGMDIEVPGASNPSPFAIVTVKGDGAVSVRRGFDGAPVKVNAIVLGIEPTPLIHGDKLEVAGHDVRFSDEKKSGSTQFLSGADLAELAKLRQLAATEILVLHHGRVAERGTHRSLLARGGLYARLYRLQVGEMAGAAAGPGPGG